MSTERTRSASLAASGIMLFVVLGGTAAYLIAQAVASAVGEVFAFVLGWLA